MSFVIAIDGPAASGKGTLSRRLAEIYGFHHLDTGLTFRATAKALLDRGIDLLDEERAAEIAKSFDFGALDRNILSAHKIGEAASKIAVLPKVRSALKIAQQKFALKEPGTVLDGRDIGTIICPNAQAKLFVTASAQVRAERRYNEIISKGANAKLADILADIQERDARDMSRKDAPLVQAKNAYLLDTSEMGIETAFAAAKTYIDQQMQAKT